MFKKIVFVLGIVFLVLQAFRPEKNTSADRSKDISTLYPVPENVQAIITKACADCHSNKTEWPWYGEIQPVGWWLADHVKDGKKHFNFNEFAGYRVAKQNHKLEECIEEVKDGAMPMAAYTSIHAAARLTDEEKAQFTAWCQSVRDTIKARYPADSLVLKKK
jgi:uncharacterized membrane protein